MKKKKTAGFFLSSLTKQHARQFCLEALIMWRGHSALKKLILTRASYFCTDSKPWMVVVLDKVELVIFC